MSNRLISSLTLVSLMIFTLDVVGQIQYCTDDSPFCPTNACSTGSDFCNAGFEEGFKGWCVRAGYGAVVGYSSGIVSPGYNSSKAFKLVATMSPSQLNFPPQVPNPNGNYASEVISLKHGFESSDFVGIISGGFCAVRHCYDFTKGRTYKGTVWLKSDDQVVVELLFRRGPDYYEAYAVNRITVSSDWEQYEIVGGFDQDLVNGSFEINLVTPGTLYVDGANIDDAIHVGKLNQPLPPGPIPSHFFGLHINKFTEAGITRPPIGFGLLRLWDTETRWFDLEPSNNIWSWERMDGLVQLAKSEPSTEVLYTLGMTPQWAAQFPGPMGGSYGWGTTSPPRNITDWEDYVTNVVNHDPQGPLPPGSIKYYELWNEVDFGAFWSGGIDKLLELQESTWNILHPASGDSFEDYLVSPNITNNGLRWLDEYLEKGGGETVDIFAFHYYPQSMMEDGIPYLEAVKSILRKHAYCCESDEGDCLKCKPIWNTEGAIAIDTATLSPERQRAAVSRSYIVHWAFGIENFSWYMWENEGFRSNISLSQPAPYDEAAPAGEAYLTTRNWLVGSTMVSKVIDGTVWKVKIIKENGDIAWIVWDTQGDNSIGPPENWTITRVTPLMGTTKLADTSIAIGIEPVLLEDASEGTVAKKDPQPENVVSTEQADEATLQLFPNPSSSVVNIQYEVPQDTHVTIDIYNSFGHKVSSLVNEYKLAGTYSTVFQSEKSSSGMFMCEYKTTASRIVSKIILIK